MEIRPKTVVNLSEYGMEGTITLEPLTFRREIELKNNIGNCMHYTKVSDGDEVQVDGQNIGDMTVYNILAYITEAPFKIGSKESFMNFMDRCDRTEEGLGRRIFERLQDESKRIKNGELSPFVSSEASPTENSESN